MVTTAIAREMVGFIWAIARLAAAGSGLIRCRRPPSQPEPGEELLDIT